MGIPTAIDMHAHYYGGLVDDLARRTARPFVAPDPAGRPVLHAMTASTVMSPGYTDLAARLAWMDACAIRTQLLTFPGALGVDAMPVAEVGDAIRAYNDHLGDVCAASGGRFVGLAGLPLADMAQAAAEMRRVRRGGRLVGAILPGGFFSETARAERLAPVFEAADAEGALLMIHPGVAPDETPPPPYPDNGVYRASALNLQASVAQMALTLMMADLPARYPGVTFQVVNLGGTLPFVLERLEAVAASRNPDDPFPVGRLRGFVTDCASLGPRALRLAVEVFGADRVMLGTDYPIFTVDQVRDTLDRAGLSPEDRAMVAAGTAASILRRLA
jgi:predicted TIM-barrel fold metal-dependent hydrolase